MIYPSPLSLIWTGGLNSICGEIVGDQARTESINKKHKFYPEFGVFQTV